MDIINNRFKREEKIYNNYLKDIYKIVDLLNEEEISSLTIYNYNLSKKFLSYLKEQIHLIVNIKHENILENKDFNVIKSIGARQEKVLPRYYSLTEYADYKNLEEKLEFLDFEKRINIFLDIVRTINFLHFRGFYYIFLNPRQIFILEDGTVKLNDMISIIEKTINNEYRDFERQFLSPEYILKDKSRYKKLDYYSLARIIEYLLLKEPLKIPSSYLKKSKQDIICFLRNIIYQLESKESNLKKIADEIIVYFKLDYEYNLIKERQELLIDSKTVGRDREIDLILELDNKIYEKSENPNLIMINGEKGVGKTKLLKEIGFRLGLRSRDIYYFELYEMGEDNLYPIKELFRQAISNSSKGLRIKHEKIISKTIKDLETYVSEEGKDRKLIGLKHRAYNKLTNFLRDLSREGVIYLILDDLHRANENFLIFLDYILYKSQNSNINILFSFNLEEAGKNKRELIETELGENIRLKSIDLSRLDLKTTGELIKNTLGMAYVNEVFSEILYESSKGSPKKTIDLIKYLYDDGQLYINKNGRWALDIDDFSEIRIPRSSYEEAYNKLSKIKAREMKIIKILSIFNIAVDEYTIKEMVVEDQAIEESLKNLKRQAVLYRDLVNHRHIYKLYDKDLKNILYKSLDEEEKIGLHRRAAGIIGKNTEEIDDKLFEELIYHLNKSEEKHRAIELIWDKIESLEDRNSFQVEKLLRKAYKICDHRELDESKLNILEDLLHILIYRSSLKEDNPLLKEYLDLGQRLKSDYHIISHKSLLIMIYEQLGREDLALKLLDEMRDLNKKAGLDKFKVYILSFLGEKEQKRNNLKEAENYYREALSIAKEAKINHYKANIYNLMGNVFYFGGQYKKALESYQKSYEGFKENRYIMHSVKPINNLANVYMDDENDIEKARSYYNLGLDTCRKYGYSKIEMILLFNLSELDKGEFEYELALEKMLKANEIAVKMNSTYLISMCQASMCEIYIEIENIKEAYESYSFLSLVYEEKQVENIQFDMSYHKALSSFYLYLGDWDKAREHNSFGIKISSASSAQVDFDYRFRDIHLKSIEMKKIDRVNLDKLFEDMRKSENPVDYRRALLDAATISMALKDLEYGKKYLAHYDEIRNERDHYFLDNMRDLLLETINLSKSNVDKLYKKINKDLKEDYIAYRTVFLRRIAWCYFEKNKPRRALMIYIELLENIYSNTIEIADWDHRISYIKAEDADGIKRNINHILEEFYGEKIDFLRIEDLGQCDSKPKLDQYFSIEELRRRIGKQEFAYILGSQGLYGEALCIESIDCLNLELGEDYHYNLNLILKYISKEALATQAYILEYDKESENYLVRSCLDNRKDIDGDINDGILKIASNIEKGILSKLSIDQSSANAYNTLLSSKEISGAICVPISIKKDMPRDRDRRKSQGSELDKSSAYLYLETSRLFNNFTEEILDQIASISFLLYLNLENNRLKRLATTDKLTGLYTRKCYEEEFEKLMQGEKHLISSFSLLMLDIDKLKLINDTYGHRKGDCVIRKVGSVIASTIRSTDIAGRYGGEEFVVILKDTEEREALMVGEKIRRNIEKLRIDGINRSISISIGVSLYPIHSSFKEDLVEKADQALYHSKQHGRNKLSLWNPSMDLIPSKTHKWAGILEDPSSEDSEKILNLIEAIELIGDESNFEDKLYILLGSLLKYLEADWASLIRIRGQEEVCYTRSRLKEGFVETPELNYSIINRVRRERKGDFLIDWDYQKNIIPNSAIPNWQFLIVLPIIRNGELMGIAYISAYLSRREFDFNSFNLARVYTNILAAII